MVGIVTVAFIALVVGMMIVLTRIEFRKITPLVFQCRRCGEEFRQPPDRDYPRACARCGATDWAR